MKLSKLLLLLNTDFRGSKWPHRQFDFGFSRKYSKLIPHLIRVFPTDRWDFYKGQSQTD